MKLCGLFYVAVLSLKAEQLHISDVELCKATKCIKRHVVKNTHEKFWFINQPMEPSGRVAWQGDANFTRAHLAHTTVHMDFACMRVVANMYTSVCVQREKEYYKWDKSILISNKVTCKANQTCFFTIKRPPVLKAAVTLVKPHSLQFWIDSLSPNLPSTLNYALSATIDSSLKVSFTGPGKKVLWFKPLLWTIIATPVIPEDLTPNIFTTLPLIHDSGFLDGIYGISD
ncbi:hypothetical protein DSO57_1022621 [Entomophthora muscae]|uniref:Uncharacterized protein n=2 Tax=Entomophthora muscae TaxID=34485 RepID=A0ACC2RU46_9FUNG|nr:hypothetical protein DSO57_1018186 [Entomophthora muscae]KAJ9053604.1 hypothetical protein DSO57_1022621 [Entomophthora muscae]